MKFLFLKKLSPRRSQVRKNLAAERASRRKNFFSPKIINSSLVWLLFAIPAVFILSTEYQGKVTLLQTLGITATIVLLSVGAGFYVYLYQNRIITNHARAAAIAVLFVLLLVVAKAGSYLHPCFAVGSAATAAIILSIAYDQRFAVGMSLFYCIVAAFAANRNPGLDVFMIMVAGAFTCCLSLNEIRTRIKLLQVGALAAVVVFTTSLLMDMLKPSLAFATAISNAGFNAITLIVVSIGIQGLLPLIEKIFRVATSMTLVEYSDANQPLLRRLAMEAPGTFSHSLMVGAIAEAAAESIGRNGLLCRVGAYYHDIGKINKPSYFVENQIGPGSRHEDLSPAMSQLIISGHVKDGKEIAKEYNLPAVLRQFIETHHGTTLIEYFFNEAKKKALDKGSEPTESEYRYNGPRPRTKEAAIVMLSDAIESATRSIQDVTPTKIEAVVHNMSVKRLQDGQLDECDMTFRELAIIQASITKTLTAHYHGRIAYPEKPDEPLNHEQQKEPEPEDSKRQAGQNNHG